MKNQKSEKMTLVAHRILFLCERSGVDSVTMSRVARMAEVSRPWLYKYIGQTKEDLVSFAFDHYGNEFALLNSRPNPRNFEEWMNSLESGFDHLLQMGRKNPWALSLYFRFKGHSGSVGEKVRKIENQFIKKSAEEMTKALDFPKPQALEKARLINSVRLALAHDVLINPKSKGLEIISKDFFCQLC
ncbi:MAG TPA: TetR/AcrR family transcriptional regulator, partial [Pseudobdellovibrionaceae bacterium]